MRILLINNYAYANPASEAVATLANGLIKRGHEITIISQKPIPWPLYPLYRLGCKIRDLSLDEGEIPPKPRGTKGIAKLYNLADGIAIWPWSFTDRNLTIQKLRKKIRAANFDACLGMMAGKEHLVWAVTMLGSGIPYIYSEPLPPEEIEKGWEREGRLAAMSGADAIHLLAPEYGAGLPDFMLSRVNILAMPGDGNMDAWEELFAKTATKKGATEMDGFANEPFASISRLYSLTKREWLWRNFGEPMPGSFEAWMRDNLWLKPKNWLKARAGK